MKKNRVCHDHFEWELQLYKRLIFLFGGCFNFSGKNDKHISGQHVNTARPSTDIYFTDVNVVSYLEFFTLNSSAHFFLGCKII